MCTFTLTPDDFYTTSTDWMDKLKPLLSDESDVSDLRGEKWSEGHQKVVSVMDPNVTQTPSKKQKRKTTLGVESIVDNPRFKVWEYEKRELYGRCRGSGTVF